MGLRRIAFAPLYRLADWVDDNPVSAVGVVVALGAMAVLFVSVSLGNGTETGALALDAGTAGILAETALQRPAYLAAVIVGLVVVLFYDG
jgi:hypothetical protein